MRAPGAARKLVSMKNRIVVTTVALSAAAGTWLVALALL
jgi:hypothetical protein